MIRHEQNGFVKLLNIILLLLKVCIASAIYIVLPFIPLLDPSIFRIWELAA